MWCEDPVDLLLDKRGTTRAAIDVAPIKQRIYIVFVSIINSSNLSLTGQIPSGNMLFGP